MNLQIRQRALFILVGIGILADGCAATLVPMLTAAVGKRFEFVAYFGLLHILVGASLLAAYVWPLRALSIIRGETPVHWVASGKVAPFSYRPAQLVLAVAMIWCLPTSSFLFTGFFIAASQDLWAGLWLEVRGLLYVAATVAVARAYKIASAPRPESGA